VRYQSRRTFIGQIALIGTSGFAVELLPKGGGSANNVAGNWPITAGGIEDSL